MNKAEEFWDQVYRNSAPKMLGICRRYIKDQAIAEDLLHEAFITAINKHESYRAKGKIEAWLRRIVINKALMHLRNEKTKKVYADLLQNENEFPDLNERATGGRRSIIENADFTSNDLLNAIEALPEHHKLVFNLYVIDNYPHKKIASELNISIGTSKSHLARARKKLQQLLYQSALDKHIPDGEAKRKKLFLLLWPSKIHFMDKLFKVGFANFGIEPETNATSFIRSVDMAGHSMPLFRKGALFPPNKLFYAVIGSASVLSIVLVAFAIMNKAEKRNSQDILPVLSDSINQEMLFETEIVVKDSIVQRTLNDFKDPLYDTDTLESAITKKTVVIRKTITIHDTITIND